MSDNIAARLPDVAERASAHPGAVSEPMSRLLLVSAADAQAAARRVQDIKDHLRTESLALSNVAFTLAVGRNLMPHRAALILPQDGDVGRICTEDDGPFVARGRASSEGPSVCMMFPGQGSQFVGMGRQLHERSDRFRSLFDHCDDVLAPLIGRSLREMLFSSGTDHEVERSEALKQTAIAQPALFVVEYALADLLVHCGARPTMLMGHSIGEFAAACLAGVFELDAALALVAERGRLMQSMPPGSMLAVMAEPDDVADLCGDGVDLAAHNAPGLVVVGGPTDRVSDFELRAKSRGLDTRALHTSHAFHSSMMDPILGPFSKAVERAKPRAPKLPIISTMTGLHLTDKEATSGAYWAQQLRNPVRFAEAAATACDRPDRVLLEVGPGMSLMTSVAKLRSVGTRPRKVLGTLGHPKAAVPAMDATLRCLGQLWVEGVPLDLETMYGGESRKLVRLPGYPYSRTRHWVTPPPVSHGPSEPHAASTQSPDIAPQGLLDDAPEGDAREAYVLDRVRMLLGTRLGVALEEDDLDRSFLELGFDSLGLSQLVGKLRQEYSLRVPVRALFEELGTPRRLSVHVAKEGTLAIAPAPQRAGDLSKTPPATDSQPEERSLAMIAERLDRIDRRLAGLESGERSVQAQSGAEVSAPPTAGAAVTGSQREILVAVQIGGDAANLAYNECRTFCFSGPLDEAGLAASLEILTQRHEALRQTFSADGEYCFTQPSLSLGLTTVDLRSFEEPQRSARLDALLHAQVATTFDLTAGPLLRAQLARLDDEESRLIMCAHHIVVDGSSWEVLIAELSALYSAQAGGQAAALQSAGSFERYRRSQAAYAVSGQAIEDEAFWLEHLRGQAEDLAMPVDRQRPAQRTYAATRSDHHLSAGLVRRARAAAEAAGCTSQTFLLAAFQVLLYRLTRQTDLIVGIPTSGQAAEAMESLVGHCVHVLPLRTSVDPEKPVLQHLHELRNSMLDGLEHQRATVTELLHKLQRPRDTSSPALIQVAFGMGRSQKQPTFAGLKTSVRVVPRVSETFDLYVYVTADAQELEVSWSYNTDLFDHAAIRTWQRCFEATIESFAAATPEQPLAEMCVLQPADREALLALAHGPAVIQESFVPVHRLIGEQASLHGAATAIRDAVGEYSYSALDNRANRIAHFLSSQGLAEGSLIGVCLDRCFDLVATLLGVWRAGFGYVPLDPAYPPQRIEMILEDSKVPLVVTSHSLRLCIPEKFKAICLEDAEAALAAQPITAPAIASGPEDTAYVIFTSGSTGRPKGVQIPHRAVENFLRSMAKAPGFTELDRLLAITTISFDISVLELFLPLVCGGCVTIATRAQTTDPKALQRLLELHDITVMQATPATWQMLFDGGWTGNAGLKVLCGGEALPRRLAERFVETCSETWNVYGPTETTVWSTVRRVTDATDVSIGRPIDNTTVYVLDEHMGLAPPGAPGELWIGGHGVALGYLGQPELSAERFVNSPFEAGDRMYRTGDLARIRADGQLDCLGRVDFQVKIRGFRIELGEIETALLMHDDVSACVVVAREGRQGEKLLTAYVVLNEAARVSVEALGQALAQQLPAYMVPAVYCVLDALPMTPNNKVDRKALPAPTPVVRDASKPADSVEEEVLAIWRDVLDFAELGTRDNFYSVGGHSLMAIRLVARMNAKYGTELPVNDLLGHPTVEGVVERLRPLLPASPMARHIASVPPSVGPRPGPHQGLFLIQAGHGPGVPLFLIHGDQANSLLLPELSPEREVWGYHHQGASGERIVLDSVEALARRCHEEWVAQNGTRPCVLAGHSFGALVAYHVAVLRQREHLETPRLIILDARHPDIVRALPRLSDPGAVVRWYQASRNRWADQRACEHARSYLDRGEPVPDNLRTGYVLGTYRLATFRYVPPEWQGELEIIRSEEWARISPLDGWERAAVGSIRRVVVEGTHLSLVRSDIGIRRIGARIRRVLSELP